MRDGVEIHEYCRRCGKVALADYEWSTVGSSNLDPLSLSLNLEANLIIRDHVFNRLHERLDHLLQTDCRRIPLERIVRGFWWRAAGLPDLPLPAALPEAGRPVPRAQARLELIEPDTIAHSIPCLLPCSETPMSRPPRPRQRAAGADAGR